jgi:hypothetical protein
MANLILSNGDEITFDMYKISIREYRELLEPETSRERQDEILSKVICVPIDKLLDFPQPDYQSICDAFIKHISTPLEDEKN